MNAPFFPPPVTLVERILAGDLSGIPGENGYHTDDEWRREAQCIADCGEDADYSELRFMCAQELAFDEWCRLSERTRDAWCGFGNYFDKQRKRFEAMPDLPGAFAFGAGA